MGKVSEYSHRQGVPRWRYAAASGSFSHDRGQSGLRQGGAWRKIPLETGN